MDATAVLELGFAELKTWEGERAPHRWPLRVLVHLVYLVRARADVLAPRMVAKLASQRTGRSGTPKAGTGTPAPASPAAASPSDAAVDTKLTHTMVRLNNNALETAMPLYRTFAAILVDPSALTWVDLSHNSITEIGGAFRRLTALKRLYLHANALTSLADVENLQANTALTALTLHANPVQEKKHYRMFGAWPRAV